MRKNHRVAAAVLGVTALGLTGCAADSGGGDGPVTLQFWAWASNLEQRVDAWNEANPDIQVEISAPASGPDMPTVVLSAARAGDGPDMVQAEYTQVPSYVTSGVVADLTEASSEFGDAFSEQVLDSVTFDDHVFGIPQDLGPALFVHRSDLFAEFGLTPATTWPEFRALAEQVRSLEGDRYLLNFSALEADLFMGLSLQAGAEWWEYAGDEWSVDIDSQETQEVLEFWQGLIEDDLVSTYQTGSPEHIEAQAAGRVLGQISGAWAPGPLLSQFPDTVGGWAGAPIPQWDPADPRNFARGGSANLVLAEGDHVEESIEFLTWLNASDEGAEGLVGINKFTAALHGQEIEREAPALMPDDTTYWPTAAEQAELLLPVQWGPNTQVAFTALNDGFANAMQGQLGWDELLPQVQSVVSTDLER